MALLTKAQVRTAVAQAIDDPSNARWSAANLDILVSLAQDALWQQILDTYPQYRSVTEAETTSGSGVIALSALTVPGRPYRVLKLTRNSDGAEFQPIRPNEAVPQTAFYIEGENIVTVPAQPTVAMTVTYASFPTKFNDLATDGTALDGWPEGHEGALIYTAAAMALTKGDAENMQQIARLADMQTEAMLDHIARRYNVAVLRRAPSVKFSTVRNPLLGTSGPEGA